MRSPHTSYRWRGGESDRESQASGSVQHIPVEVAEEERIIEPIQVYALTPTRLQVERERESRANKCMRSPHTATGAEEREGERIIETIKMYRLHHTPATGGEERES